MNLFFDLNHDINFRTTTGENTPTTTIVLVIDNYLDNFIDLNNCNFQLMDITFGL